MEDMDWPSTLPILDNNLDEVEAGGPERLKWDSEENETNNSIIHTFLIGGVFSRENTLPTIFTEK